MQTSSVCAFFQLVMATYFPRSRGPLCKWITTSWQTQLKSLTLWGADRPKPVKYVLDLKESSINLKLCLWTLHNSKPNLFLSAAKPNKTPAGLPGTRFSVRCSPFTPSPSSSKFHLEDAGGHPSGLRRDPALLHLSLQIYSLNRNGQQG